MVRFVTVSKYAELSGHTEKAVRHLIDKGEFVEDVHFKRRPNSRCILIDLDVIDQWVSGKCLQELRSMARNYE